MRGGDFGEISVHYNGDWFKKWSRRREGGCTAFGSAATQGAKEWSNLGDAGGRQSSAMFDFSNNSARGARIVERGHVGI